MGWFGSKNKVSINSFSKELTSKMEKRYPVSMDTNEQKVISEKKLTKILEDSFKEGAAFKVEHKLGVFGKAKLINAFKWDLTELGYSKKFIDVAVEGMTVYVSRAR